MFIPCDLLPGGCCWLDQDWAPDSRHAWNVPTLPIWNGDSELTSPFIKVRTKGEAEVAKLGSNFGSKVDLHGHAFDILKFCTHGALLPHASPVPGLFLCECIHEMQTLHPDDHRKPALGYSMDIWGKTDRDREKLVCSYPEKLLKKEVCNYGNKRQRKERCGKIGFRRFQSLKGMFLRILFWGLRT